MRARGWIVLVGLLLLTVRCAHVQTRGERECKARVDTCMRNCAGPPPPGELEGDGCESSSETQCEERCYESCSFESSEGSEQRERENRAKRLQ